MDAKGQRQTWYSRKDTEVLCDLLTSMTQYRPSNRPSITEVLHHPWFASEPSLASADDLSRKRDLSAYFVDTAAYRQICTAYRNLEDTHLVAHKASSVV